MRRCSYYQCTERLDTDSEEHLTFCIDHQLYLQEYMQYDISNNCDYIHSLAYILSALSPKVYKTKDLVL